MNIRNLIVVFVGVCVLLIGDFISFRIIIPKMVSSQNDFLVLLGFILSILLGAIHWFAVILYANWNKLEK